MNKLKKRDVEVDRLVVELVAEALLVMKPLELLGPLSRVNHLESPLREVLVEEATLLASRALARVS